MAEHPAIVALARVIHEAPRSEYGYSARHPLARVREQAAHFWETLPDREPNEYATLLMEARAAYAAVLKDLMEPSEAMVDAIVWLLPMRLDRQTILHAVNAAALARAREIGVEI